MSPVARSRQAHSTEKKKKKKITENQKIQLSRRWQRNQIGGRESIPQCPILPIEQIKLNSKPNTEHTERNTERQRFLSKKKKKIPNTQIKTKPQQTTVTSPRRRSSLVVVVVAYPSSQIGDRPLLQCSLRPSLKVFLSFSLSLYLTVTKMKNKMKFL